LSPGRSSISIVVPISRESSGAMARAISSDALPGEKPSTSRMG
jgi:hypothetical protein